MDLSQQEAKKAAVYALTEAEKNCFMPEESLTNDESDEELRNWLISLGVSVQKLLEGAVNLMKNTVWAHSAWRVGSRID